MSYILNISVGLHRAQPAGQAPAPHGAPQPGSAAPCQGANPKVGVNHPTLSSDIPEIRIMQELILQKKGFQQKIVFRFRKKSLRSCNALNQFIASVQLAQDNQPPSTC